MAHELEKQIQQYQRRFRQFLNSLDTDELPVDLNQLEQVFNDIPTDVKQRLDRQITQYQKFDPSSSFGGFIRFIGRRTANSLLGPVGLSLQDFESPERLAAKAKKTALQSVQSTVAGNIRNPSVAILRRIQGRGRNINAEGIDESYLSRVNERRVLLDGDYTPESYESEMRRKYPEEYNRIQIIQNNGENSFYTNYKILHREGDEQLSEGLDEHLIKFHITNDDEILIFRMANFNGLTDNVAVTWEEVRYFGRPEPLKQYDSVTRDITFNFDVFIDVEPDIDRVYRKLDILTSLCYPNKYTNDDIIQPNIIRLSIGKYVSRMPFFITSLSFTADEEMHFADGKPRIMTVSVTGDVIQPESNPQRSQIRKFIANLNEEEQSQAEGNLPNPQLNNPRNTLGGRDLGELTAGGVYNE